MAELASIATAITALVGVFFLIRRDVKRKSHENWVEKERSLIKQIGEAQTNEERAKLVKDLHDHRSSNK